MPTSEEMVAHVSRFFGKAGLDVQIGSTILEGDAPEGVSEWTSRNGVAVRSGDLIQVRVVKKGRPPERWSEIVVVTSIFIEEERVELAVRLPDDPDRLIQCWLPWLMGHEDNGWHREVRKLTPSEYGDEWRTLRTLKPGWHKLETSTMEGGGRVHIGPDGVPTRVERRRMDFGIGTVCKVAEITTGYDLKLEARYCDEAKTQRRVKAATRREPPNSGISPKSV